jgi:hypothetical protein
MILALVNPKKLINFTPERKRRRGGYYRGYEWS